MRLPSLKLLILSLFWFATQWTNAQFQVPKKPAILYPIYDSTGTLSADEVNSLNQKLIKFNDSTSVQIQVVIIPTTNDEDVNFAAWQIGEKWGIRNKNVNNGIVFLIAKDDRKMSIQQGRDAEQYITASTAGQILDYMVTPYFKQGDFYEGINQGTSAIMDAVRGKFKPIIKEKKSNDEGDFNPFLFIIIVFFIIIFLIYIASKNNDGNGGNNDDSDVILSRRGRRNYPGGFFPFPGSFGGGGFGGGSSGGGFGGGFGGFGGGGSGGFGGGGASGGW